MSRCLALLILLVCGVADAQGLAKGGLRSRAQHGLGGPGLISAGGPPVVTLLKDGQGYDAVAGTLSLSNGSAVTVSRSGVMTCTTDDWATFTTVAANKPCVVGGALHVAPGATNLHVQSEDLSTSWSLSNATISATNSATFADGALTMDTVTPSSATGHAYQHLTVSSGTGPWTNSGWMRAESGTAAARIRTQCITTGNAATCTCWRADGGAISATMSGAGCNCDFTASTTRMRVGSTITCDAANTTIRSGFGSSASDVTIVGGTQFETGSVATPYIPTIAATVTRGGQTATVPTPAFLTNSIGCVSANFFAHATQGNNVRVIGIDATSRLAVNNTDAWIASDGSTTTSRTGGGLFTTDYRYGAVFWTGSAYSVVNSTGSTAQTYDGSMGLGATIGLGATPAGGSGSFGRIKGACFGATTEACSACIQN